MTGTKWLMITDQQHFRDVLHVVSVFGLHPTKEEMGLRPLG